MYEPYDAVLLAILLLTGDLLYFLKDFWQRFNYINLFETIELDCACLIQGLRFISFVYSYLSSLEEKVLLKSLYGAGTHTSTIFQ